MSTSMKRVRQFPLVGHGGAGVPLLVGTLSGLLVVGPFLTSPVRAQDDFSFDIVEEGVQDTDTARYDQAKDDLSQERFADALAGFEAILADKALKRFHEPVEYDMAKALFRMGAFHSSLQRYQKILDAGPKHAHFAQARDWLFFISRKMEDELAALQLVATYAKAEDIPADQQSDLSYSLARFYFLMALNQGARGVEVEQSAEDATPASSDDDDSFNFSDDDLGGGDEDGFGFGFDLSDDAAKKKKPKKKSPAKKPAAKPAADADPLPGLEPAAAAPTETTKKGKKRSAGKSHKNENPQSAEESLEAALGAVNRVNDRFALFAQAQYLKGLIHFARGEFEPAVKAFRNVVRMTNPRASGEEGVVKNAKLREMAFFSLARIHYQFEQFRYAIFYYDRISRDSETWLEAVFESSWAYFRLGEYEKALGNLVTLQSPFFLDEYYPESSILKAITFYENCRYPEARAFLGEFRQNYGGVLAELDRLVGSAPSGSGEASTGADKGGASVKTAEQLFEELTDLERKVAEGRDDAARSIALTARLLRLALSDKRVKNYRLAINEVDEEKQRLLALDAPFNGGAVHGELLTGLDARRAELVNAAGTVLRDRLESEQTFLRELSSKLIRIQFEIVKMEKETLEATLSNQNQAVTVDAYGFTPATDDERLFWPFEGEYWRDELGTYQYTLTKGCRPPSETTVSGD
jgi:tetratricopeptide (TPR) repeat protein